MTFAFRDLVTAFYESLILLRMRGFCISMSLVGKYARSFVELPLGEGAYGFVFKARDSEGQEVAIKEMKGRGDKDKGIIQSGMREICALKHLKHENIVTLLDVVCTIDKLFLVLECLGMNLFQWFRFHGRAFSEPEAKGFFRQVLRGLEYCHDRNFVHRDIKPNNILFDLSGKTVKICDFGCARTLGFGGHRHTSQICSIWYRPPELLLGCKIHGFSMDMWSMGCVFAEMVERRTLFCSDQPPYPEAENEIIQGEMIFSIMGFPTEATWPRVTLLSKYFAYRNMDKFLPEETIEKVEILHDLVPRLSMEGIEFLSKMLCLYPGSRISASKTLEEKYMKLVVALDD